MSVSTHSRPSSIFSRASAASSHTSAPSSPTTTSFGYDEKSTTSANPFVFWWKPQLFACAFSLTTTTGLRFTSFPPQNIPKPTFESLSRDSAVDILHQDNDTTIMSLFAGPESQLRRTNNIPIPSNLPGELAGTLRNDEWEYYTITDTAPLPLAICALSTKYDHHIAIRKIPTGVERCIFGPAGLSIHSTCRIHDAGTHYIEDIPRETLFLVEDTEVLCNTALRWWMQRDIQKKVVQSHEKIRARWEGMFMAEWLGARR